MHHHSDGAEWGLPTTSGDLTLGNVKPIGVAHAPVYSFRLQDKYSNYQRSHNVGFVTDYVVQIACRTLTEHVIRAGDVVCAADGHFHQGNINSNANIQGAAANGAGGEAGSFKRFGAISDTLITETVSLAVAQEFIIGRCLRNQIVATGTANTKFKDDSGTITITATGKAEFKGLNLVETRGTVAGSGTQGVPGHILEGLSDSNGNYRLLTVLVRL